MASIPGVTPAPTVLILAAGQGTRMRSRTPKVLHELCGIPMVLWPVRAALAAGAGRVVVVDSPDQALQSVLPEGVRLAVQPSANGTGGAVVAAIAQLDAGPAGGEGSAGEEDGGVDSAGGIDSAPVVVLSGDVPLVSAETIVELVRAHEQSGAGATMASTILDDPSGYGRVVRDGMALSSALSRRRPPGTRRPSSSRYARSTPACTCSRRMHCAPRCRASAPRTPRASCICRRRSS